LAVRESYSIKSDRARGTAPGFVKFLVVIYFWGLFGFALGTLVLLGPVRWWATLCRDRGFSEGFESGGVVFLILLLIATSMSLALWASTEWVRTRSIALKLVLPIVALGVGYYAYSWWMNPSSMKANMGDEQVAGQHFTFGPFPDKSRLAQLKKEGYTGVISLLHPAVVPFEPKLIEQEREAANEVGIEMIHLPMLPWVSENKESLDKLKEIAESKKGRYYVHCYLGEDRVNVARRVIETTAGLGVISGRDTRKSIESKKSFERGEIYQLDDKVYLTPFPTDEEFGSYILGGQISTVIALLDPESDSQAKLIAKERRLFDTFKIDYELFKAGSGNYDPAVIQAAAEKAKTAKRPVIIHSFFPASHKHGGIAQAFLQSYMSGKPAAPPHFFDEVFRGGLPNVVAPNVVVGPEPSGSEWEKIEEGGVRKVIVAGGSASGAATSGARSAGLALSSESNVDTIVETLASGGPYYVFGPSADEVKEKAATRYGPAVPTVKRHDS